MFQSLRKGKYPSKFLVSVFCGNYMSPVSIPEKREIPFEEAEMRWFFWGSSKVSIPEKREIPFEVKIST